MTGKELDSSKESRHIETDWKPSNDLDLELVGITFDSEHGRKTLVYLGPILSYLISRKPDECE